MKSPLHDSPHVDLPDKDALLQLVEVALDEGRPTEALDLCQQLLASHPGDTDVAYLEAEAYRDLREAEVAEDRYRAILDVNNDHADAWSGLGSVLFDQCRFDEAARCHARALRLSPEHPDALYGRAMLRERRGDARGAHRDYIRAWQASPRYPMPHHLDDADVRKLVVRAAGDADPVVSSYVAHTPLIVLDVPDPTTCEAYDPPASPGDLLGHFAAGFEAPNPLYRSTGLPPALLVFRRNLERFASDDERLVHVLREAVLSQVEEWLSRATVSE